jgi:hypothetical protein
MNAIFIQVACYLRAGSFIVTGKLLRGQREYVMYMHEALKPQEKMASYSIGNTETKIYYHDFILSFDFFFKPHY